MIGPANITHGDFNEDGRDDILVSSSNLLLVTTTGADGFATARDVPFSHTNNYGGATAEVGDINGDGHLDVVLIHDDYSNNDGINDGDVLEVFFGDGKGSLTVQPRVIMGRRGSTLAGIGDFDGDGKLDLLLSEGWNDGPDGYAGYNWPDVNGPSAWVWRGDGEGGFSPGAAQPVEAPGLDGASAPGTVTIADVNGDGKPDILFGGSNSTIPILLNDGKANLIPSTVALTDLGSFDAFGGYFLTGLAVADFNRDGLPDFVKISPHIHALSVFLGQPGGAFKMTGTLPLASDSNAIGIEAGDLNGDGILDLMVDASTGIETLLGRGDGTFGPHAEFVAPGFNVEVAHLGDVNGDGKLDVIVALNQNQNTNDYAVFFGLGTGALSFNQASVFPRSDGEVIWVYQQFLYYYLTIGDFDGDGKLDILDPDLADYIRFHVEIVECPFCAANLADLQGKPDAGVIRTRRSRILDSSRHLLPDEGRG
jgi:hypothetical protein